MDNFINCLNEVFSNTFLSISLLLFLLYATYTDIKYLKIYDKFNLLLIITRLAFIFLPIYSLKFSINNIIASFSAFTIFLIIAMIFMHRMGGDIKFIGAFMLFFNVEYMLVFITISSLLNTIYALTLKFYLKSKQARLIEKDKVENYFLSIFIKLFLIKLPSNSELIQMDEQDFNKYKLPFAPFFLMSYLITYILYLLQ